MFDFSKPTCPTIKQELLIMSRKIMNRNYLLKKVNNYFGKRQTEINPKLQYFNYFSILTNRKMFQFDKYSLNTVFLVC